MLRITIKISVYHVTFFFFWRGFGSTVTAHRNEMMKIPVQQPKVMII